MARWKVKRGKIHMTGVEHPRLFDLTFRMNRALQKELDQLEGDYRSGNLSVNYSRYRKLRHGIMNKYAITRNYMEKLTEKHYAR